jgi:hypothetical protein
MQGVNYDNSDCTIFLCSILYLSTLASFFWGFFGIYLCLSCNEVPPVISLGYVLKLLYAIGLKFSIDSMLRLRGPNTYGWVVSWHS